MRFLLVIICLFLVCGDTLAQNLVPNPSFEQVTACPNFASQLDKAAPWYNPTLGSPELYHGCAPLSAYVSVPMNTTGGFQYARTGIGYAGLFSWRSDIANVREYAEVELLSPLQAGSCYRMTMYVNRPDDHAFACDGFGAYFSVGPIGATHGLVLPYTAHIENPPGALITDTVGWTEITGIYSASGGETHLTIGNFRNDANTQSQLISNNVWYTISAYMLVDDVSVVEIPLDVDLGPDTLLCSDEDLLLDATLPGATYLWSTGSTAPALNITGPGTYWVTVSMGACSASDTIVVSGHGLPVLDLPEELTLCPGASLILDASVPGATIRWMDGDTTAARVIDAPGSWSVEATNECGTSAASVDVRSDICPCVPYLPSAFSPNNDGINDTVGPYFSCASGTLQWSLFDRWGKRIHQADGTDQRWDGTVSGSEAPTGVYVWRIDVSGVPGSNSTYTGHLVLVR